MTLLELAERCERATGPDRELDCAIREAVEGGVDRSWQDHKWMAPEFTASLDAAMTLLPKGHQFGAGLDNIVAGPEGWAWVSSEEGYQLIRAVTPALALVSAALRARATLPEGEER